MAAPIRNRLGKLTRPSRRLAAAAAAFMVIAIFGSILGIFNNGPSARYWLLQAYTPTDTRQKAEAIEAFERMGPRGDATLISALHANESWQLRFIERVGSGTFFRKLPVRLQTQLIDYYDLHRPPGLRSCAERLAHMSSSRSLAPKLLPLLADTNEVFRVGALGAMLDHLGPDNVTGAQLHPLSATAHDGWPSIRLRTAICLAEAGPCATNELATLRQLSADTNAAVRVGAAWALDQLNASSNAPALLAQALSDCAHGGAGEFVDWEFFNEWPEAGMQALTEAIAGSCLTNADAHVRASACLALNTDLGSARKNVRVFMRLLDDSDAEVRKRAAAVLRSIRFGAP